MIKDTPQTCQQCETTFYKEYRTKYCGPDCYHESKRSRIEVQCDHCGKTTVRTPGKLKRQKNVFCSPECQQAAQTTKIEIPCDNCGKTIKRKPSAAKKHTNHFCSRKCQGEFKEKKVTKPCFHCGKLITRPQCQMKYERQFCSTECKSAAADNYAIIPCKNCGEEFESFEPPSRRQSFCSQKCRGEYRSKTMSGENSAMWTGGWESYYGPNWNRQSRRARKRDNHTCQVCGLHESSHYRALDVHHIKPFRSFGYVAGENENYKQANKLSNLVTLCPSCHGAVEHGDTELPALLKSGPPN